MEREKKCPDCGCEKIAQAKLDINAKVYPIDAFFKIMNGSEVSAEICTKKSTSLNLHLFDDEEPTLPYFFLL
ncbi:hypothetical protein G9F72_021560 [Clostridium estertheticum]|uniref:hypothetical protein n=1 Tax=Clostridium estertheticum TaxID=238834 RepID=UPI001CD0BFFE|nr:hypothetical protein [Clostridium estertheticum]MBZ9688909.1 hypothetical protein [Clostridium estertheticum]